MFPLLLLFPILISADLGDPSIFSFPPNNTPVTKVYIFGTPVYVRQPFVLPLREPQIDQPLQVPQQLNRNLRQIGADSYPLAQCYTNDSGFMCCNKRLEDLIHDVFNGMKNRKVHTCNMQSYSNNLQKRLEDEFGTDFEVINGVGDFASKVHFWNDFICKVEIDGRFVQAYATPGRHVDAEPITVPYRN